jgi:hypothetical protein
MLIYRMNTEIWNIDRPAIFFTRLPLETTMYSPTTLLPPCEGVVQEQHGRGDRDTDAEFDQEYPEVLAMGGFVGQKIVVQIVPAQQQRLYPHTRVEQHARCRKYLEDARRHRLHGVVEAKYQRVEDDAGRPPPGL